MFEGDKFPRGGGFPRKFGPGGTNFWGGDIFPVTPAFFFDSRALILAIARQCVFTMKMHITI